MGNNGNRWSGMSGGAGKSVDSEKVKSHQSQLKGAKDQIPNASTRSRVSKNTGGHLAAEFHSNLKDALEGISNQVSAFEEGLALTIDRHRKAATKLLEANETALGKSRSVYGMLDKSARAKAKKAFEAENRETKAGGQEAPGNTSSSGKNTPETAANRSSDKPYFN